MSPITEKWNELLEAALKSEGRGEITEVDPSTAQTLSAFEGVIHKTWHVGSCVVALAEKDPENPVILVSEKVYSEKMGSTFRKEYGSLKTKGFPNFERIVRTALDATIRLAPKPGKKMLPKGMLVQPDVGGFQLHIPSRKVTTQQLERIIEVLSDENIEQYVAHPAPSKDDQHTPESGGTGVEVGESPSKDERAEGELPAVPETSIAGLEPSQGGSGPDPEYQGGGGCDDHGCAGNSGGDTSDAHPVAVP